MGDDRGHEFVPGQMRLVHGPRCRAVALSVNGPWAVVTDMGSGWCLALLPEGDTKLYREGGKVPSEAFFFNQRPEVFYE